MTQVLHDTLTPTLKKLIRSVLMEQVSEGIPQIVDQHVDEVERFMKRKAPWTDRSGEARRQLAAKAFHEPGRHVIVAYHQVEYGYYLEVAFNGRFGIILLTIETEGEALMEKLVGFLSRLEVSL